MNLNFNQSLAKNYTSESQKIRVLSEDWVAKQSYCPSCNAEPLVEFANNQPVADFYCSNCDEEYELKSKKDKMGKKIVDGAYSTMIERLQSASNPNFFFLNYDRNSLNISNFILIPKHFFTPEIIEKRKPLSSTAKRAGWIGCNILLETIPQSGKIFYIKDGKSKSKNEIVDNWNKTNEKFSRHIKNKLRSICKRCSITSRNR